MALIFPAPAQIKNLLAPTANTDAATKLYVDTQIGSVSANAAGSNTQVQFNSSSSFGASSNFTFDTASNVLTVTGNIISSNASLGNLVTSNYFAGTLTTNAQPNITSVGTLTSLSVTGDVSGNNFTVNGNLTVLGSTLTVNNEVVNQTETITGNLVAGNVSFTGSNVSLGNISNLHISGGTSGYFLKTDGSGNLSWAAQSSLTSNVDNFTGDGSNTAFTLSSTPAGANYTMVAVQGVLQPKSTYTVSGSTLTFSSAPPSTAIIEVTTFGGSVSIGGGGGSGGSLSALYRGYTGDGSTTTYTVTSGITANTVLVATNGVLQRPTTDYTISGSVLTFVVAPDNSDDIQIRELSGSSGSSALTWNIASSNSTMTTNNGYFVDTSAGPKTMTLPASPSLGDTIRINDLAGSFSTNNLTVARNGNKIQGAANDLLVDVDQSSFGLVYSNSTYGWKVLEL
jgi:Domain of unknown function (DUF4183)